MNSGTGESFGARQDETRAMRAVRAGRRESGGVATDWREVKGPAAERRKPVVYRRKCVRQMDTQRGQLITFTKEPGHRLAGRDVGH